jgi:hypothetical protein
MIRSTAGKNVNVEAEESTLLWDPLPGSSRGGFVSAEVNRKFRKLLKRL